MRRYVKCMAASAVTVREQNARPSTARRSRPDGKRSAQGAGMCRGASAAGAKRSPEQPGAAQRQPLRRKHGEADSRGVRPGTSGWGRWPGGKAGVASAGRTAAAGHSGRRRPGGFWPGRAGRHGVGDARRAAKAAGLVAPGHGARSRRSAEGQDGARRARQRWPGESGTAEAWQASGLLLACQAGWRRSITAVESGHGAARARQRWRGEIGRRRSVPNRNFDVFLGYSKNVRQHCFCLQDSCFLVIHWGLR